MATSIYKGYIRHNAGQLTDNSAFGAAQARDHLVNNANHIADSAGQVLINWSQTTTTSYRTPTLVAGSLADDDVFYKVTRFGPVPLLLMASGSSYQLRVRMRWYLAAAGTGTAVVAVSAAGRSLAVLDTADTATNAATFETTATVDAWDNAEDDNLISLDADAMAAAMTEQSTLTAVAGTDVSVAVPLVVVDVYAKSSATSAVPRLTGLYLAEYIGT